MTEREIANRIETFIRKQFAVAATDASFTRAAPLFELGYIDSVGVVELLAFLHEQFQVEITDAELLSEDFQTLNGIARIVHRLRAAAVGRRGAPPQLSDELPAA